MERLRTTPTEPPSPADLELLLADLWRVPAPSDEDRAPAPDADDFDARILAGLVSP